MINDLDRAKALIDKQEQQQERARLLAAAQTKHIRRRLPRRGGNQFYRDRRHFEGSTFCGAEMTAYDVAWAQRSTKWTLTAGQVCPDCIKEANR